MEKSGDGRPLENFSRQHVSEDETDQKSMWYLWDQSTILEVIPITVHELRRGRGIIDGIRANSWL